MIEAGAAAATTGTDAAADTAEARRRAGRAVRDLGHALVGRAATPELLAETAASLDGLTARLAATPERHRAGGVFSESGFLIPAGQNPINAYDDRPFSGLASPWGLDLRVHRRGDEVEADLVLREAHEGAAGRSHGGIVAGLFDDVFGFVLGVLDQPAFTGELSVRYERPTPLHRRLLCRGRLDRREGRKLWTSGELVDATEPDQPVLARGTGLFITVDRLGPAAETQELPVPDD